MTKILTFAGSARSDSFNKRLARAVTKEFEALGAVTTYVDLADYPMPIYDGDTEQADGVPQNAVRFRQLLMDHEGFVVACPEYNSSITPLLKNVIDWCSRPTDGVKSLVAFQGKCAGLLAASPGALGGLRGLVTVRSIFGNIGAHVIPNQVAVPKAHEVLNEDGSLGDDALGPKLAAFAKQMHEATSRLSG